MLHKIINTVDYLLIVDDSEIKEGDWYVDLNLKQIFSKSNPQISKIDWQKKIIAHLPLNNSPILEGVDLLPPLEDEVHKLVDEYKQIGKDVGLTHREYTLESIAFKNGYNKSKEKYKYTEEDLRKAIDMARTLVDGKHEFDVENILGSSDSTYGIEQKYTEDEIIESLQQPKIPVGFKYTDKIYKVKSGTIQEHKDGLAGYEYYEWVGEWIY